MRLLIVRRKSGHCELGADEASAAYRPKLRQLTDNDFLFTLIHALDFQSGFAREVRLFFKNCRQLDESDWSQGR